MLWRRFQTEYDGNLIHGEEPVWEGDGGGWRVLALSVCEHP